MIEGLRLGAQLCCKGNVFRVCASLFCRLVRSLNSCRFTFVFFTLDRIFVAYFVEDGPEMIAGVSTTWVELRWQLWSAEASLNWLF